MPDRHVRWNEVVLKDGSRIFGTIVSENEEQVVLKNQAGTVVVARRDDIDAINQVTGDLVDGRSVPADPNATRLFFGPTGRSLARGQTYLGVYEFLMPFVQVGITDRLSIGGGTPLVFGFDDSDRPFWLTPKLQLISTARVRRSRSERSTSSMPAAKAAVLATSSAVTAEAVRRSRSEAASATGQATAEPEC